MWKDYHENVNENVIFQTCTCHPASVPVGPCADIPSLPSVPLPRPKTKADFLLDNYQIWFGGAAKKTNKIWKGSISYIYLTIWVNRNRSIGHL